MPDGVSMQHGVWIPVVRVAHNFAVIFDKCRIEKGKPHIKRSSSHGYPLAPYAIVSSTNSKAQVPNPKLNYTDTNSINEEYFQHSR